MKKIIKLTLLLTLITFSYGKAQTAYLDAAKLKVIFAVPLTDATFKQASAILYNYTDKKSTDAFVVQAQFKGNPFIPKAYLDYKKLLPKDEKNSFLAQYNVADLIKSNASGGILTSAGNLDVTNIANGLAEFMVKRAKEELTIAFFTQFQKFANKHPEFKVLFPKTTDNLNALLSFSYTQWLPALRSGFYTDLQNIPGQLDSVLNVDEVKKALTNFPELKVAIRSVSLLDTIAKGKLTESAFDKFANFPEFADSTKGSNDFKNFSNGVKLANIFSKALTYTITQNTVSWISPAKLANLIKDSDELNIFLALIYQQIKSDGIRFYYTTKGADGKVTVTQKEFYLVLDALSKPLPTYEKVLNTFISIAANVDSIKNDIQDKKSKHTKLTNDDYHNYINSTLNIIEYGFDISKQFDNNLSVNNYIPIAHKANDVYLDISKEQYTQATVDVIFILDKIDSAQSNKQISKVLADVTKYGLFIANMISAQSPDDVESLVESAVLPVGSSSIKKNSDFNFAIQSYLGVHYNTSIMSGNVNSAWTDKFGISAPIGVSVSYGFKKWGAVSVFGSLFDLGAIVDYQLKKDSVVNSSGTNTQVTSKNYQVKLGQIVSPGLFLVYGIGGNIPLSVGFGYQYGPGLGKINSDGTTVVNNPSGRWGAFLSVDIPLINLINISKKTKYSE